MKKTTIYLFALLICLSVAGSCKKSPDVESNGTVYFLVSEIRPWHGDSYVLPLTDAEDIAMAESIIAGTTPAKIVVAVIARGSSGGTYRNKDILTGRIWSWHVAQFNGFADITVEVLDSWPGYIEENLEQWMQQNNGQIGFWTYTVTRKLTPEEVK